MSNIEYRVRPVERFIVTKFESGEYACGSSTVGEYPNADTALAVKNALELSIGKSVPPGDYPLSAMSDGEVDLANRYAVVQSSFEIQTLAFYARGADHAKAVKEWAEMRYGGSWEILERMTPPSPGVTG